MLYSRSPGQVVDDPNSRLARSDFLIDKPAIDRLAPGADSRSDLEGRDHTLGNEVPAGVLGHAEIGRDRAGTVEHGRLIGSGQIRALRRHLSRRSYVSEPRTGANVGEGRPKVTGMP
jgi:hypothetical protein